MLDYFHKSIQNSPIIFPYKTDKTFPFSYESGKDFSVMNYGFILLRFDRILTPIRNNLEHASVSAVQKSLQTFPGSSRIRQRLHKCERSINV